MFFKKGVAVCKKMKFHTLERLNKGKPLNILPSNQMSVQQP